MILALSILLAIILRAACGHSLGALSRMRIRGERLFIGVLAVLLMLPSATALLRLGPNVVFLSWMIVIGLLFGLCAINGRESQGFRVMAVGVALNALAISANRHMPVSRVAVVAAGGGAGERALARGDAFHSAVSASTSLVALGDVIPLPGFVGLRSVLSVGDVVMFVGILIGILSFSLSARESLPRAR